VKYKEQCRVISNEERNGYIYMRIMTENIAEKSKPGQFVNIRTTCTTTPLLRRPFSICDAVSGELLLMIFVKGSGTAALLHKKPGDFINIIGPLGNSFPEPSRPPLFIAGGAGAAPFVYLSRSLPSARMLLGARSSSLLPDIGLFDNRCAVHVATDDGTCGEKGTVINLLEGLDISKHTIYACGPNPMLRALSRMIKSCDSAEAYYSIETTMGCGFGACKGCTVETKEGDYKLACIDGPVFPWNGIAL